MIIQQLDRDKKNKEKVTNAVNYGETVNIQTN